MYGKEVFTCRNSRRNSLVFTIHGYVYLISRFAMSRFFNYNDGLPFTEKPISYELILTNPEFSEKVCSHSGYIVSAKQHENTITVQSLGGNEFQGVTEMVFTIDIVNDVNSIKLTGTNRIHKEKDEMNILIDSLLGEQGE